MSFVQLTDAYEWTDDCPECDGHGGDFSNCDHPGAVWTGSRHVVAPTATGRLLAAIQWPRGAQL